MQPNVSPDVSIFVPFLALFLCRGLCRLQHTWCRGVDLNCIADLAKKATLRTHEPYQRPPTQVTVAASYPAHPTPHSVWTCFVSLTLRCVFPCRTWQHLTAGRFHFDEGLGTIRPET